MQLVRPTLAHLPGYIVALEQGWSLDSFRGTTAMPAHSPGHIGYAVVPWKQRKGYATSALRQLLDEASVLTGLPFLELMTGPDNLASRHVIEAVGGTLQERFTRRTPMGERVVLRYRIDLASRERS